MELKSLLQITDLTSYSEGGQIDIIGNLFDLSFDSSSLSGIEHAFALAKQIDYDKLSEANKVVYHYDLSNGWNYTKKLKYSDKNDTWNFQLSEISEEIFHLRKAISLPGFDQTIPNRKCQILTNLGNTLSYIGRFVEAQEYWTRTLEIIPYFPMALANKGNGLYYYGNYLFDMSHRSIFNIFSYHYLDSALQLEKYLEPGAASFFRHLHDHLEPAIPEELRNKIPNLNKYPLGKEKRLRAYRLWSLANKLYVNPLNDLGNYNVACHDCLNLPNLIFEIKKPPIYITMFNQIKQEFGTARFSYFDSTHSTKPHYSDTDIVILETFETARYSYYIEQIKMSFRLAYSILDKTAFLLNDYLKLGINPVRVSFRSLWYENYEKRTLRNFFAQSDNWALRGLFWLSKDLYETEQGFETVIEPDAREIAIIRNHIEHKAFKIVSDFEFLPKVYDESNDISYTITRSQFEAKTLKLLKLVRATIIYLSLAINHEEQKKDFSKMKTLPIVLNTIDHAMKF